MCIYVSLEILLVISTTNCQGILLLGYCTIDSIFSVRRIYYLYLHPGLHLFYLLRLINEALTADESGDKQAAVSAYEKALQKLTNAISACKGNESLNEMKRKMEKLV